MRQRMASAVINDKRGFGTVLEAGVWLLVNLAGGVRRFSCGGSPYRVV
jgi:hypothetical protein